jgi:6-phosphogluconolactonase
MAHIVVGSRNLHSQDGLTLLDFDPVHGALTYRKAIDLVTRPSFQCWDPQSRILYTVSEKGESKILGLLITEALNTQEVFSASPLGSGPCHLTLSFDAATLAVSNYRSGSFTLIALDPTEGMNYSEEYEKSGPVAGRQEASHIHSSLFIDGSSSILVADLGGDAIYYYRNRMQLADTITAPPGSGPRHMAVTKDERFLFVTAELSSEVLVYRLAKVPTLIQRISTIPAGFTAENTTSHIALSSDERHLYVANRGHDSLVRFSVKDGWLDRTEYRYTERIPWHFAFSEDERFIIVANAESDSVTVYPRNPHTGELTSAVARIGVDTPSCITAI